MTSNLVLSLFPGLELLDRAFREQGFCVVAGPDRLLGADIRDFHAPPDTFEGVIGGSPCQAFSALANLVRAKALKDRGLCLSKIAAGRQAVIDEEGEELFRGLLWEIGEWLGLAPNLVPEFERVVEDAAPRWFLHENVPAAPVPRPRGYAVRDFEICNSGIAGPDGLGQEQERVRRFAFGVRGCSCPFGLPVTSQLGSPESKICATCGKRLVAPNLRRWIQPTALRLPATLHTGAVSRDDTRGKRDRAMGWGNPNRTRTQAVVADNRAVPVAVGGSGKLKRTRQPAVAYDDPPATRDRLRRPAVVADPGTETRPGRLRQGERRTLGEMLCLQGLPEDLLDDAPFTAKASRKLVANGVPLPLGRAVAKAVRLALEEIGA